MSQLSKGVIIGVVFSCLFFLTISIAESNSSTRVIEIGGTPDIIENNFDEIPDVNSVSENVLKATVTIITSDSSGSGWMAPDGRIVTAWHVVSSDPDNIGITFNDGRVRTGTVDVFDEITDIAAIQLDEPIDNVPALEFEEVENIKLGDFVLAIGSPLGLDASVSLGLISNVERNSTFQNPLQRNLIQTDAAVNPGNSGGPLVNLQGRVVGIIQLRPDVEAGRIVTGVGLALRSDAIQAGFRQLDQFGNISFPQMGIIGRGTTTDDGLLEGVIIENIVEGSAASETGLATGDVILTIDNREVFSLEEILTLLWDYRAGDELPIAYVRGDATLETNIILAEFELPPPVEDIEE